MAQLFKNNSGTVLSSGITDVQLTFDVVDASQLPAITAPDWCWATITQATGETAWEIVKVTNITANTLTVERGQQGTAAQIWSAASKVSLRWTSGDASGIQTDLAGKQPLDAQLTSLAGLAFAGNAGEFIKVNATEDGFELIAVPPTTPGGAGTNVQINDANSFYGESDFTYNKTTKVLAVSGAVRSPLFNTNLDGTSGQTFWPGYTFQSISNTEATLSNNVNYWTGVSSYIHVAPPGGVAAWAGAYGGDFEVRSVAGNTTNFGYLIGLYGASGHLASSTTSGVYGLLYSANLGNDAVTAMLSGATAEVFAYDTSQATVAVGVETMFPGAFGTSSIATAYGVRVHGTYGKGAGASIGTLYGVHIADASLIGAATHYNLYSAGANSINRFEGVIQNYQAVAATSVDGLVLATTSTATVGAQKWSPAIRLRGSQWYTTDGSATTADCKIELVPLQSGVAAGMGYLYFRWSANGAAYSDPFRMDQAGNIAAGAYTVNGGTSIVGYTSLTSTSFRGSSDSSFLSFGVSADTFLYRNAAASWRFGGDAANPPVPQIQSVQNASGNNISGAVWTQIASLGTGDATQAKAWSWKTGDPGVSGSTLQTATEKWYMTGAGALVNTQAVAATSVDGLVLQTSATATVGAQKYSPALHFKGSGWGTTGGAAQSVDWRIEMAPVQGTTAPNARLGYASSVNEGAYEDKFLFENSAGNTFIGLITNGKIKISSSISNYNSNVNTAMFGSNESQFVSGYYLGWASSSTNAQTSDAFLTRGGAANLQLGRAAANPPVPQTQSVQDASGTNISPAKWTFRSSRGTGNAVNTGILYEWQTPDVGVSGTTLQTATAKMALTGDGKLYVGAGTAPTATLHLKAGSTAASSSPLKFTAGPLMSAVEEGAMEFKDHTLYFTTFQVRRSVVLAQEILTAQVQVPASSTTETTVYTIPMAANYLTAGKKINNRLRGTITQRNNVNSFFTVRVKYAGSTVLSFTTPASTVMAALAFTIDIETVCRAIGAAGTLMSFGAFNVQGVAETLSQGAATTVDTTAINTLTITVQANENNAGTGPVNVEMGETICPDHNA